MGVYRLPKHASPCPIYSNRDVAPAGFGGSYNWLCQKPLPYIDSYKTSSGVGLFHVRAISERYDRLPRPLPCQLASRDSVPEWDRLLTSTALAHDAKQHTKDPTTFAGNYRGVGNIHLVRKFDDHIKHRPHNRCADTTTSVTAATYRRHDLIPTWGRLCDLTPAVECKVRREGREEQPPVLADSEGGGSARLLDPMLTTTALHFPAHSEHRQSDAVGKKDVITYWDAEGYPRAEGWGYGPRDSQRIRDPTRSDPDPIYDKERFSSRAVYRRLPTRVPAVPNKGLQSEQQASFGLPLDDFVSHRWCALGVEYPLALYDNSLTEALTVPGMYCPESAHYGSRIPVKAMVDTGPADPIIKRIVCP